MDRQDFQRDPNQTKGFQVTENPQDQMEFPRSDEGLAGTPGTGGSGVSGTAGRPGMAAAASNVAAGQDDWTSTATGLSGAGVIATPATVEERKDNTIQGSETERLNGMEPGPTSDRGSLDSIG